MALPKIVSEGPKRVVDAESPSQGSIPSRSGQKQDNTTALQLKPQYLTEIPATTEDKQGRFKGQSIPFGA